MTKKSNSPCQSRLYVLNQLIQTFEKGQSLSNKKKSSTQKNALSAASYAWSQQLIYTVCRYYGEFEYMLSQCLNKPLKTKDYDVELIMIMGIAQLSAHMSTPAHAAIFETVDLCQRIKKPWAKRLVNAVLRNAERLLNQETNLKNESKKIPLEAKYSHPLWIIETLQHDWPENWEAILQENQKHAPMILRANKQKLTKKEAENKLNEQQLAHKSLSNKLMALQLDKPCAVDKIIGFEEGYFSVQDVNAQWIQPIIESITNSNQNINNIWDSCSAPGGKTAALLELNPDFNCVASDKDPIRQELTKQTLKRLNLTANIITLDICNDKLSSHSSLNKPFDLIILDAPCSGSGVIRRHPDIKWLRRETDIYNLAETQIKLLNNLWPKLCSNGYLLYMTCSVFDEENSSVIAEFLASNSTAVHQPLDIPEAYQQQYGKQLLPGQHHGDGFYYCLLKKK